MAAINKTGNALEYASEELKGDKEVVLVAVNQKEGGYAVQFASEELKGDKQVVLAAVNQSGWALQFASPALQSGGLESYLMDLFNTYTVPPFVFWSTILCGTKIPSAVALAPGDDATFAHSVAQKGNAEGASRPTARLSRTEAGRACYLSKLDLGDDTSVFLMKKIAAFAGVQCQEFCGVPWSQVVKVGRHMKI